MTSKRDIERRLDDLEGDDTDTDLGRIPTDELAEAWQASIAPERPSPVDASDAYIELLDRKYEDGTQDKERRRRWEGGTV